MKVKLESKTSRLDIIHYDLCVCNYLHGVCFYDGVMYSWVWLHHHCLCDVISFPLAWAPPVGEREREL